MCLRIVIYIILIIYKNAGGGVKKVDENIDFVLK